MPVMPLSITVFYNQSPLSVYLLIAERLDLHEGQELKSYNEFRAVVRQNATHYALLASALLRNIN